jgi:FAD/FMN-containing dehydrogenase
MFDAFSRGRYATDASFYQIMPVGVALPRDRGELAAALAIAREEGVAVTPRGGGTSQNGQTINESLVVDTSRHLNRILEIDPENRRCVVEPGVVLDELNRALKPHGCGFRSTCRPPRGPPSAAWPATIPAAPVRSATAPCATT